MASNWDQHRQAQSNARLATPDRGSDGSPSGQRHDRIHADTLIPGPQSPIPMGVDNVDVPDITAGQKMLSAVAGSFVTALTMTPLDVVRVRLQSQIQESPLTTISKLSASSLRSFNTLPPNLGVTACCREVFFASNTAEVCIAAPRVGEIAGTECVVEETQRRTFNSTLDGLRKIARNEGILTLWRGLTPTLAMAVPANIIYFTGYDWLRYNPKSPLHRLSDNLAPLVVGGVARVCAAGVVSPIEMFRTRMQASRSTEGGHFKETANGIREMVSTHGYTSLWRGFSLTLWRDVPFSMIYWWGYETGRAALMDARERRRGRNLESDGSRSRMRSRSRSREKHMATFTDSFTAGAASGTVATIVTMPFDVGKTRRQVFKDPSALPSAEKILAPEEMSMPRFLWHIFQTEGVAGLYRGWIPRTAKVAPACAIMISSYEVLKRTFRSVNERSEQNKLANV